jgi:hypothetical protein
MTISRRRYQESGSTQIGVIRVAASGPDQLRRPRTIPHSLRGRIGMTNWCAGSVDFQRARLRGTYFQHFDFADTIGSVAHASCARFGDCEAIALRDMGRKPSSEVLLF